MKEYLKTLATLLVASISIALLMTVFSLWKAPRTTFRDGELSITQRLEGFLWWKISKRYTINFASGDKQIEQFGRFNSRSPPYQVTWRAECSCIESIRDYREDVDISLDRHFSTLLISTGKILRTSRFVERDEPEAQSIIAAASQRLAEEEALFAPIIAKYKTKFESSKK